MNRLPKRYDIVWISAEPHSGREIGGHDSKHQSRPLLVLSKDQYNQSGFVVGMGITSHNHVKNPVLRKMMIHIISTDKSKIHGFIIPFQIPCWDYLSRNGRIVDHISNKSILRKVNYYLHNII